jgi:arylsulfatase A-like enzyme
VVFEDATAQSSWTLPSMASLLTGRHVFVNAQRMPDGVPALAERLGAAGYETAAFIGNPAVSDLGGFDRGFQHFVGRETTGNVTWNAADLRRALVAWRAEHPRDGRPRFLYLHFMDPHFPYDPQGPRRLPGETGDQPLDKRVRLRDDVLSAWIEAVQAAGPGTPLYDRFDVDRRHVIEQLDAYDREIANVDGALRAILATDLAPRERLVIVAADHGEGLWDHRHHEVLVERDVPPEERSLREVFFRDHSYPLWQELVHTPLIVSGPGFPTGLRVSTPVENVDIVPTLLRAAGLETDPELDGRPLQEVATGTARPRPVVYSFCNEATEVRDVEGGWKLVFPTPTGDSFGMPLQLYRLDRDPYERENLADRQDPEVLDALRRLLKLREESAEAFDLYDDQAVGVEDPEHEAVLRELGYLGGR